MQFDGSKAADSSQPRFSGPILGLTKYAVDFVVRDAQFAGQVDRYTFSQAERVAEFDLTQCRCRDSEPLRELGLRQPSKNSQVTEIAITRLDENHVSDLDFQHIEHFDQRINLRGCAPGFPSLHRPHAHVSKPGQLTPRQIGVKSSFPERLGAESTSNPSTHSLLSYMT